MKLDEGPRVGEVVGGDSEAGEDAVKQIDLAYRLALVRPPTASETRVMLDFLKRESLEQMCRVIFNLNEFAYVD